MTDEFDLDKITRSIPDEVWLKPLLEYEDEARKIREDNAWLTDEKKAELYQQADGYAGEEGIPTRQVAAGYQVLHDRLERVIALCLPAIHTDSMARAVLWVAKGLG